MTYDTFKKAERLLRQMREFKELIGQSEGMRITMGYKHIQAAEDDEEIKKVIEGKIKRLQDEFDSL